MYNHQMEGSPSQATESNLYSHQEAKKIINANPRFDWPPWTICLPIHHQKNSGWGIKNSVAEHNLNQQNKEHVKESKSLLYNRKKKAIWRIS